MITDPIIQIAFLPFDQTESDIVVIICRIPYQRYRSVLPHQRIAKYRISLILSAVKSANPQIVSPGQQKYFQQLAGHDQMIHGTKLGMTAICQYLGFDLAGENAGRHDLRISVYDPAQGTASRIPEALWPPAANDCWASSTRDLRRGNRHAGIMNPEIDGKGHDRPASEYTSRKKHQIQLFSLAATSKGASPVDRRPLRHSFRSSHSRDQSAYRYIFFRLCNDRIGPDRADKQ